MDACRLGQTVACTDDVGTCSPRTNGGNTELPICVPETLCENCPNSDDTTGTSGIDASCEMDARMDPKTLRIDCKLAVTPAGAGRVQPCLAPPTPVDFAHDFGPGWICAGAPLGFSTAYATSVQPQPIRIGGNATAPDYLISAHCLAQPAVSISYDAVNRRRRRARSRPTSRRAGARRARRRSAGTTPTDILGVPFQSRLRARGRRVSAPSR